MINMRNDEETGKDFCGVACEPENPEYPYNLKITLRPEDIKKLGFLDHPTLGDILNLSGLVEVVEVRKDGKNGFSLELQITDMSLATTSEKKDVGSILYGGE